MGCALGFCKRKPIFTHKNGGLVFLGEFPLPIQPIKATVYINWRDYGQRSRHRAAELLE
jgi:hypothetical protein